MSVRRAILNTPINISRQNTTSTGWCTLINMLQVHTQNKIRSWKIYILPSHHSRHDYVEYVPMSDGMQTLTTEQHSPLGKTTMCWRNATMSQLTKWKCKEQLSYSHKYKNILETCTPAGVPRDPTQQGAVRDNSWWASAGAGRDLCVCGTRENKIIRRTPSK